MKIILIILTLIYGIAVVRADLVMELSWGPALKLAVKVKGDKIRYDFFFNGYGGSSLIADLKTGDSFNLEQMQKSIIRRPSIVETNVVSLKKEWPRFQDTDKTEKLNGYEAEIYKRTSSNMVETLWVAKDYPNFDKIKSDLVKLDQFKLNDKKVWMPELSSLSGMPLKLLIPLDQNVTYGATNVSLTLISAKEESIDDSVFELPKDYHFLSANTNAPVANTNKVISATNETPTK
ncbi:MAG: DUF4412 domain-containing protein [Limisphaerales bacterium]